MKKLILLLIITVVVAFATITPASVSPNSGGSSAQQLTFYYSTTVGPSEIGWMSANFGNNPNATDCRVESNAQTGEIRLYNENGLYTTGYLNTPGIMSNAHCGVNKQTSWQYAAGSQAWFAPDMQFYSPMANTFYVWGGASNSQGGFGGWFNVGSWNGAGGGNPTVALSSPALGGSGSFARFAISATGANQGWTSLQITSGAAGWGGWSIPYSCDLLMYPSGDVLIGNDQQSAWTQQTRIGTVGAVISNTQCKVNLETSQFSPGSTKYWYLDVAFTANFLGTKNVIGLSSTSGGSYAANPTAFGTWTINETSVVITPQVALQGALTIDDRDGVSMVHVPSSSDQYAVVKLRHGGFHMVARANNVHVSKIKYSRDPVGQSTAYRYKLTCPDCYILRMGIDEDADAFRDAGLASTSKVYRAGAFGFSLQGDAAAPVGEEEYSLTSTWRPGLMPIYFASRAADQNWVIPYTGRDAKAILDVSNIFVNSKVQYVIGPAIKPDVTKAELLELVQRWVDVYGFDFLKPIVDAGSLDGLAALTVPDDDLSRDIVACLKGVIVKE